MLYLQNEAFSDKTVRRYGSLLHVKYPVALVGRMVTGEVRLKPDRRTDQPSTVTLAHVHRGLTMHVQYVAFLR